ncbi:MULTISPECIES: hypothetical protein [unclassified Microcoleus]|uniref:hypothetical protein n=1 Tax=unclassified Microcoleus TaxID=2642155 RepID=UPI002FCED610
MNQVKKTTTKLNRSPVKLSDRTLELGNPPLSDLSLEITDGQALRNLSSDDRPPATPTATGQTAETRRRRVDGKTSWARSPVVSTAFLKWLLESLTRSKGWLAVVTLAAVWGWWNSELLFSTGLGIAAMMLVYRGQSWDWQLLRAKGEEFWEGPNRRFVLAVGTGGIATLGAYMSLAIWADSESHWMALSLILQNLGTIAIAGLLLWQGLSLGATKDEVALDRILADLTDADPVKRLIAVRQMTDLVNQGGFGPVSSVKSSLARSRAAECFRLMLSREPEALVRNALLEGLQTWDATYGMALTNANGKSRALPKVSVGMKARGENKLSDSESI